VSGVLVQERTSTAEAGRALLDDPAADALDALAREAALTIGSVASLVSVLDGERSFLRGEVGLPLSMVAGRQTPLLDTLCLLAAGRTEPLIVADSQLHGEARVNSTLRRLAIRSCLGFPLIDDDGSVLGSFVVIGEGQRFWDGREIELVRRLAAVAAVEVSARLDWQLEAPEPELLRAEVGEAFSFADGLEDALCGALQTVCEALGWDAAGAWLVEEDREELSCRGYWHAPARGLDSFAEICRPLRFGGNEDMVGTAWIRREPIWSPELPAGERFPRAGVATAAGLTCGAWIPLLAGSRSLGALELLAAEAKPLQARTVPQLIELGRRIGELVASFDGAPAAWKAAPNGPFRGLPAPEQWLPGGDSPTIRRRA
jgi:GAF domain-containing protein